MKRVLAGLVFATAFSAVAGNVYYVDANHGNDMYDGSTATPAADAETSHVGPKKTIQAAAELVTATTSEGAVGDTIWLAPGHYNEGTYTNGDVVYRAFLKSGCRLIASGRKDETFVEGAKSTDPGADNKGNGPGAVKGFNVGNWVLVKGVTVCGCRTYTTSYSSSDTSEGRTSSVAYGQTTSYFVDCIISNNFATGRGGCFYYGPSCIRCYFANCNGNGIGAIAQGGTQWNCVFDMPSIPSYALYYGSARNCTFLASSNGSCARGNDSYVYNCLSLVGTGDASEKLRSCVFRGGIAASAQPDGRTLISVGEANSRIDGTYAPVVGYNVGIDYGSNELYSASFPTAPIVADQKNLDFWGNPRIVHGRIDVGAVELDWNPIFSHDLASVRVMVTNATVGVHETSDKRVAIPAGEELSLVWQQPEGHPEPLEHCFSAQIAEGASLKVYRDGEAEPSLLLTAAAPMPYVYTADADQRLTFVAEDGEVVLSDFRDCAFVDIEDSDTGLTVTGVDHKGRTELEPGATVTVSFSRNFTSEYLLKGILANGEYVSFEDHEEGWTWSYTATGLTTSLRVEAVYSDVKDWYVNPVTGDDARDGRTPARAVRTLAAAAKLVGAQSATRYQRKVNTIYLAPGVYAEGIYTNGTNYARGCVPNHTRLVATGSKEETVIMGARSDAPDSVNATAKARGCGPGAVRCLYVGVDAFVIGVTLTGGCSTGSGSDGALLGYGRSSGSWMIDCIATNNCAADRGGVTTSGIGALRCFFDDNYAPTAAGALQSAVAVNCLFGTCSTSQLNVSDTYNCTFMGVNGRNAITYDGIIYGNDSESDSLKNCLLVQKAKSAAKMDGDCLDGLGVAKLPHDADYVPRAGSLAIDRGATNYLARVTALTSGLVDPCHDLDFSVDYLGRPRIVGGRVDAGAFEYDWRTDPPSGLSVDLRDLGGGTSEVSVSRNFSSELPTLGFAFGDEEVSFGNGRETWKATLPTDSVIERSLRPIYGQTPTEWYVDAGAKGDDANPGYLPECPKHTLTGIVACAKSGHVVHAAPGVYNEGAKKDGSTMTRVVVPAGVGLVADGPGETVIEGVISQEKGHGGPDSVRCVACGSGAYIKGFVLRNGSTSVDAGAQSGSAYGDNGGGIAGGTAIDCIITNCYAVRGGGSSSATLIRCRLMDCFVETGATNAHGALASTTAVGMYNGNAYDSYLGNDVLNLGVTLNCFCAAVRNNNGNPMSRVYNSYVETDYGYQAFTNCVLKGTVSASSVRDADTVVGTALSFDANSRPLAGQVSAIDRGMLAHYAYPAAFAHEQGLGDLFGGQRVSNGQIDIGPGEYDWRGDFAKTLAKKGVEVSVASPGVTTNAVAGLDVADGETLKFACTAKADGTVSFRVTGAGTVAVTYGGMPLEPADGVYSVEIAAGTSETFAVSYAGEGVATVSEVALPRCGTLLLVR